MPISLKPLAEQTIVITGATSGIGLVTARQAATQGARLVLAARTEDALDRLVAEISAGGGQAVAVVADVGDEADVHEVAQVAITTFGGFDAWVNNAGVSIYGKLETVPVEDMRRLFDTNYWGVVNGSLQAVKHLKARGGAIINVGSTLSDRAILLQGAYSASKHAVKGFTDALRMELERDELPISVTLIKPSAIDTPYVKHARNYMAVDATVPPPVYSPALVAQAILHAAAHPTRDIFIGGGGKGLAVLGFIAPRLADRLMERFFAAKQQRPGPPRPRLESGLECPSGHLEERGNYEGHVIKSSPYTTLTLHPKRLAALLAAAALVLGLSRTVTKSTH